MDIRKVKKLIELLEESNLTEIEIVEGEESVRLSRGGGMAAMPVNYAMPQQFAAPPQQPAATPVASAPAPAAPEAAAARMTLRMNEILQCKNNWTGGSPNPKAIT